MRSWFLLSIALTLLIAVVGLACGPSHLTALGNPGDLCTERTACTEGTGCRITELGYRCVLPDGTIPGEDDPSREMPEPQAEEDPDPEPRPTKRSSKRPAKR